MTLSRLSLAVLVAAMFAASAILPDRAQAEHTDDDACEAEIATGLQVRVGDVSPERNFSLAATSVGRNGVPNGNATLKTGSEHLVRVDFERMFFRQGRGHGGGHQLAAQADEPLRVGIRGTGYLVDGTAVLVRIDVDRDVPEHPGERARVRWRPMDSGHDDHEEHDLAIAAENDCGAGWTYNSGWFEPRRWDVRHR